MILTPLGRVLDVHCNINRVQEQGVGTIPAGGREGKGREGKGKGKVEVLQEQGVGTIPAGEGVQNGHPNSPEWRRAHVQLMLCCAFGNRNMESIELRFFFRENNLKYF